VKSLKFPLLVPRASRFAIPAAELHERDNRRCGLRRLRSGGRRASPRGSYARRPAPVTTKKAKKNKQVITVTTHSCVLSAWASDFIDSSGRTVRLPDSIKRIIPAGPPAEALLYSLAPETLVGLIEPWSDLQKQAGIEKVRDLPTIPRITRKEGTPEAEAIQDLHADIIIDYGSIDARYTTLADKIQSATGIPYLVLDGRLTKVPDVVGRLGSILHREERAREIAKTAEFALQKLAPITSKTVGERVSVYYARRSDGLQAIHAGSSLDEGIGLAGGRNVVSPGEGTFSVMSVDEVAALKPSVVILADPKAAEQGAPLRKALPTETRFLVDRGLPYGWIERPPSPGARGRGSARRSARR
jgi:iron complex transport system substrate-binding protein